MLITINHLSFYVYTAHKQGSKVLTCMQEYSGNRLAMLISLKTLPVIVLKKIAITVGLHNDSYVMHRSN